MSSPLHPLQQVKIAATPRGADLVIALDGTLAVGEAAAAQAQLLNLVATATGRVVLDCARLVFISSAGIRALLALHRNLTGRSRGLVLAGVSEPIRNILDVAGLAQHLAFAPTVEAALAG